MDLLRQLLSHSANNRANAELFAKILGEMATTRLKMGLFLIGIGGADENAV